jgi:hypothetical protein
MLATGSHVDRRRTAGVSCWNYPGLLRFSLSRRCQRHSGPCTHLIPAATAPTSLADRVVLRPAF